jgi:acyl-CoA thioester hydrolase, YbgC/YbaW family
MNKIRVYYEDTDASGRVYHANYLKYLERGRSNIIYQSKYNHQELLKKFNIIFVVKSLNINYLKPAFFEDIIEVQTSLNTLSRVKLNFNQKIIRNNELLVDAEVIVIPINTKGKIIKLNEELYSFLKTIS